MQDGLGMYMQRTVIRHPTKYNRLCLLISSRPDHLTFIAGDGFCRTPGTPDIFHAWYAVAKKQDKGLSVSGQPLSYFPIFTSAAFAAA